MLSFYNKILKLLQNVFEMISWCITSLILYSIKHTASYLMHTFLKPWHYQHD